MSAQIYDPGETCCICLSKYKFPVKLKCGHKFWKGWIREWSKQSVMIKKPITCPECWADIDENVREAILSTEILEKYEEFQRQNKVDRDPNRHWCPRVDWDMFVFWVPNPNNSKTMATWDWGYEFWIVCHDPWHPKKKCYKSAENN